MNRETGSGPPLERPGEPAGRESPPISQETVEPIDPRDYLRDYLDARRESSEGGPEVEKIEFHRAADLPEPFRSQLAALRDDRLDEVTVAVVPDELWPKGDQPSESHADRGMILVKQSYFEAAENPDEIAWILHELAHCQNRLEVDSAEAYDRDQRTPGFPDLQTEHTYPNNLVERYTFTRQFGYLKESGRTRQEVEGLLARYYDQTDRPFFERILDDVYGRE